MVSTNKQTHKLSKGGSMTLIQTVPPEEANGDIKKGYDLWTERGVEVPTPIRMLSASPDIFKLMIQRNQYYSNHPNLSFSLLSHIRYFVSTKLNFKFCSIHNKNLLLMQGLEEKEIDRMGIDPEKSMLEDNERQMVAFVLNAMDGPESITEKDIDQLRGTGWTDNDIFDALAQGVGMIDHSIFMKVFKPDF